MKLMSIIGASIAAALLFATPSFAAVTPAFDQVAPLVAPAQIDDCVVSLGVDQTILFVEANSACDVTMAEITGLCLTPVTEPLPLRIAAVLAPDLDISCTTTIRPSPPG